MSPGRRFLLIWARRIHVYLAMFGFVLLLFFAATGFMLNHQEWFDLEEPHRSQETFTLPTNLLVKPDKLKIVEALRKDCGANGALDSFDPDDPEKLHDADELRVVFKSPGRRYEAIIKRDSGETEVNRETNGVVGLLTDLHRGNARGKATGDKWGLVVDSVCVVILILAATGLILWSSLRGRAYYGLVVMAFGILVGVGAFYLFVP